ncbi:hypothetical protein NKG05_20895 [Oerskovia sp. M15]
MVLRARISLAGARVRRHGRRGDRVTMAAKPLAEELAFLPAALEALRAAEPSQASAYSTKFFRVQVFGAVYNRPQAEQWPSSDREALAAACRDVLALARRQPSPLHAQIGRCSTPCLTPRSLRRSWLSEVGPDVVSVARVPSFLAAWLTCSTVRRRSASWLRLWSRGADVHPTHRSTNYPGPCLRGLPVFGGACPFE